MGIIVIILSYIATAIIMMLTVLALKLIDKIWR